MRVTVWRGCDTGPVPAWGTGSGEKPLVKARSILDVRV
jgi:hypothetical protein